MRLRIIFSKTGSLRYIGHLDLHRIWIRTCRRSGIPLSYSQGFHPQPRISLASALPLGFFGLAEIVDVWLDQDVEEKKVLTDLKNAAPPGLILSSIQRIDPLQPALQTQVQSANYEILFLDPVDIIQLASSLEILKSSITLPRLRRNKPYDLRPLLESVEIKSESSKPLVLFMRLKSSPAATGRPEEVLAELGINHENTRITRTQLNLN